MHEVQSLEPIPPFAWSAAALIRKAIVERAGQQDGALGCGGPFELSACPPGPAVRHGEPV